MRSTRSVTRIVAARDRADAVALPGAGVVVMDGRETQGRPRCPLAPCSRRGTDVRSDVDLVAVVCGH